MTHVEILKNNFIENGESERRASVLVRSMVMQSLLHIGSRSFSHFLNAMERYLQLLRTISTAEGKSDVLDAAGDFWRKNYQMLIIVFDKLMQYQIVDPTNVITWAFAPRQSKRGLAGLTTDEWQLVKGALAKAIGRVAISKRKLATLRKEEDDARARVKARTDENAENAIDVDGEVKGVSIPFGLHHKLNIFLRRYEYRTFARPRNGTQRIFYSYPRSKKYACPRSI